MFIYKAGLVVEQGSRTVARHCPNCNNDAEFVLCSAKTGPGIGVPIVSLFTQKAVLAKKSYYLVCPICETTPAKVARADAQQLKAGIT